MRKPLPRRLVFQKHVVKRIKFDELRIRNPGGEDVSFRDRHYVIAAGVYYEGRSRHLSQQVGHFYVRPRLEQPRGDLRRCRLAAEIVEPAELLVGSTRNESRCKYLTERRIITAPPETHEIDHC